MTIRYLSPYPYTEDGYSNSGRAIRKALEEIGHTFVKDPHARNIEADIDFVYGPARFMGMTDGSRPTVMFTMFETTKPPNEWKEDLHKADVVVTPTQWCSEVFRNHYDLDRVVTVPLAYDQDVFVYPGSPRSAHDPFTFISFNSGFAALRKGFLELVEAYKIAFPENDGKTKLIVKSSMEKNWNLLAKVKWEEMTDNRSDMEYIAHECSSHELVALCHSADCFVFPSRAEGFGCTPLEAMGTGLPCVIPNQHGISEYFNPDFHLDYDVIWEESHFDFYEDQDGFGKWPVADTNSLAASMRYVFENQEEMMDKGAISAEYAKMWSYDETAKKLDELFKELCS